MSESKLDQAAAALRDGAPQHALPLLEPLLRLPGPDAWVLAAEACAALGKLDDMGAFLRVAQQRSAQGFASPERAEQLEELGAALELYNGQPRPGPSLAGRLAALAARIPCAPAQDPAQVQALAMHLANLLRSGQQSSIEALLEPRADEVLPGLSAQVRTILAELGAETQEFLPSPEQPDHIFIGGVGRSGTTLFRSMLHAHPRLHCGPEAKLVPIICGQRQQWLQNMKADLQAAGIGEQQVDRAVRAFLSSLLADMAAPGQRVAEKTPHNLLHMAYLGRLFPRARFLHVIRDGRAVVASLLRQRWLDATGKPVWYCADAQSAARYWRELITATRQQVPIVPGRYLELRYEALVEDPERELRRVLAFLGERWDPAVLQHERSSLALSPLESSSAAAARAVNQEALDKWRQQLDKRALNAVLREAGTLLRELCYGD